MSVTKVTKTAAEVVTAAEIPDMVLDDDDYIVGAVMFVIVKDSRDNTGIYFAGTQAPRLDWLQLQGLGVVAQGYMRAGKMVDARSSTADDDDE